MASGGGLPVVPLPGILTHDIGRDPEMFNHRHQSLKVRHAVRNNQRLPPRVKHPLDRPGDDLIALPVKRDGLDQRTLSLPGRGLARGIAQDMHVHRQGFRFRHNADGSEVVEVDLLTPVTTIHCGRQTEAIAGVKLVDGGREELRPNLVNLVIDHHAEGPLELRAVITSANRMQKPNREVLALPLATVLLNDTDPVLRDAELVPDLLSPLIHQPFEMQKD